LLQHMKSLIMGNRELPRYLRFDLIGRTLVLVSVGWQILILNPHMDEQNARMLDKQFSLIVGIYATVDLIVPDEKLQFPYKISAENLKAARDIRWDARESMDIDIREMRTSAYIVVIQQGINLSLFVVGSILTIVSLWLEKTKESRVTNNR
jgi:hypothetical protein